MSKGNNGKYIEQQLTSLAPLPLEHYPVGALKVKLFCEDRSTNYIDITPETQRKIEWALAEQATKKDSEE